MAIAIVDIILIFHDENVYNCAGETAILIFIPADIG